MHALAQSYEARVAAMESENAEKEAKAAAARKAATNKRAAKRPLASPVSWLRLSNEAGRRKLAGGCFVRWFEGVIYETSHRNPVTRSSMMLHISHNLPTMLRCPTVYHSHTHPTSLQVSSHVPQ